MAAPNTYLVSFAINSGITLDSVNINSTPHAITPIVLDPTITTLPQTVQNALNALGFGFLFTVTVTGISGGNGTINILSTCTNNICNSAVVNDDVTHAFTPTVCSASASCSGVTATVVASLTIDCTSECRLTFQDETGAYSISNTTGYNAPNAPSISNILSTTFLLFDSTGNTLLGTFDSNYIPSSDGLGTICLTASDFGLSVFVGGTTYKITYRLNLEGSSPTCKLATFVYPCCGNPLASNLATNFAVQMNTGGSSMTFTDTTGTYNAQTNPGGYGTPNPAYGDITSTVISIALSNGQTINITTFIPTAEVPYLVINAATLGYGQTGVIPDQIMAITYSVYVAGQCRVGYKSEPVLWSYNTYQCLLGQMNNVFKENCDCANVDDAARVDRIIMMWLKLQWIQTTFQQNQGCVSGDIESLYQDCKQGCSEC